MSSPVAPWITAEQIVDGPCAGVVGEENIARLDRALLRATQLLYVRTGRRWPGIISTVGWRPSKGSCGCSIGRPGCNRPPEIVLPGYPVISVDRVEIDGVVVDPATYRVDDDVRLVRMPNVTDDRNEGWPCCQRMDRGLGEEDTFGIDYTWGSIPDDAGLAAVAALGCELSLAADPNTAARCSLPKGVVRSITRQGLSMELATVLDLDSCGITDVTYWLAGLDRDQKGIGVGAMIVDPAQIARHGRSGRWTRLSGS